MEGFLFLCFFFFNNLKGQAIPMSFDFHENSSQAPIVSCSDGSRKGQMRKRQVTCATGGIVVGAGLGKDREEADH